MGGRKQRNTKAEYSAGALALRLQILALVEEYPDLLPWLAGAGRRSRAARDGRRPALMGASQRSHGRHPLCTAGQFDGDGCFALYAKEESQEKALQQQPGSVCSITSRAKAITASVVRYAAGGGTACIAGLLNRLISSSFVLYSLPNVCFQALKYTSSTESRPWLSSLRSSGVAEAACCRVAGSPTRSAVESRVAALTTLASGGGAAVEPASPAAAREQGRPDIG